MATLTPPRIGLKGDPVWNVLTVMLGLGILFIFMSCAHVLLNGRHYHWNDYWTALGTCLLLAGGCYSGGVLIGFMFGIPRVLSNPMSAPDDIKNNTKTILQNDNLVQISDWLTKIIVGVGLTQLTNIPHFLNRVGQKFACSTGAGTGNGMDAVTDNSVGVNSAIIILVYFTVIGFFFGYLWSRLFFPKMLANVDAMLNPQAELNAYKNTFQPQIADMKIKMESSINDIDQESDPQKGKWGGQVKTHNRQVTGTVAQSSTDTGLFTVTLDVTSTDAKSPLMGDVIFHLHPSIQPQDRSVRVVDGIARLGFLASKPFTVGIQADNGATQLEIDLDSDIRDVPVNFK